MKDRATYFITMCVLLAGIFVAQSGFAQGIRESSFSTPLDTFWVWVNPAGDATLTMTGTQARISVPGPNAHEPVALPQGGNRTPRLIQRITPPGVDYGNFDVYAKFDSAQNRMYTMQGILAVQDNKNLVRAEIYSDTLSPGPPATYRRNALLFTFTDNGDYNDQLVAPVSLPTDAAFYLRLQRVDSTFTLYWATDTTTWNTALNVNHQMYVDSLGVYVANGDSLAFDTHTSPSFSGLIDHFGVLNVVPVQLASFSAALVNGNSVRLNWMTVSETNNYGFEVQKSRDRQAEFQTIANSFIPGHGTTNEPRTYAWTDFSAAGGNWYYRLKQIDLDGSIHYNEPVQVSLLTGVGNEALPTDYALEQNYPNPFNPSTTIAFSLPKESRVRLDVYNLIGQQVATILDGIKGAGTHQLQFDASQLVSGVYVYKLSTNTQSFTRRMVLMK